MATKKNETFTYTTENGTTIEMPNVQKRADTKFLRLNRNLTPSEFMWRLIEEFLAEEELALLDSVPLDEFSTFNEKWGEFMGITLGESEG